MTINLFTHYPIAVGVPLLDVAARPSDRTHHDDGEAVTAHGHCWQKKSWRWAGGEQLLKPDHAPDTTVLHAPGS